ncbi:Hypothetical_protein [Hexamita inflata]|uniref:Hypothetical_protein n=1 Tax=Hexamita inflata TaxID=28002 RepID=A0AA86QIE4_9EUKA|nr:Hypothetical protein HINF_LOCUS46940 [Hexamita inflata]
MSRLTQAQITSLIDGLAQFIVTNVGLEKLNLEASQLHSSCQVIKAYDYLLNSKSKVIDTRAIHKTCTTHLTQKLKEVKGMEKECSKQACDGNKFYRSTILSQISDVENNNTAELKKQVAHIVELVQRLIKITEANGSQFAKFSNDVINTKNGIVDVRIPKLQVFQRLRLILASRLPKKYLNDLQNKVELVFKNSSKNQKQDLTFQKLESQVLKESTQSFSTQSCSNDSDEPLEYFQRLGQTNEEDEIDETIVTDSNLKLADAVEKSTTPSNSQFEFSAMFQE